MKNTKPLFLIAFLLCSTVTFSQRLKYDLVLLGKNIGTVMVEKKVAGGFVQYTVTSHSYVKILTVEKKDDMITQAVFNKQGRLSSSTYTDVKNEQHLSTRAAVKGGKLLIDKDSVKSEITEPVTSSSAMLFFAEPKAHQRMFSERMGKIYEIAKEESGKYKVSYEGYTAIYTYSSGHLAELEMKEAVGSVTMRLAR